jgi:lysophospholipase L1-like esterase
VTFLRALGRGFRSFWLMLGITLALVIVAELVLGAIYRARDSRHTVENYKTHSDAFANSPWASDYFDEDHKAAILDWHSYVYWRLRPFHGRYVNVDENGIRRTWQSPDSAAAGALNVFVLGGSTTWGNGSRDDHTVPSELSRLLHERGVKAHVTNFGESGYVSMQELITLELQLRQGNVPDLVIFYDGVNDTYSAWQQGRAGIPQNEHSREVEFNMSNPRRRAERTQLLFTEYAQKLALRRFADSIVRHLPRPRRSAPTSPAVEDQQLSVSVVATYSGHMELVRSLANTYGFKYVFFWQPNLFEKKSLTKTEQVQADLMKKEGEFFRQTYDVVRAADLGAKSAGHFHDISTIFTDETRPVYFDFCHMGEEGNHAIAAHMIDPVMQTLSASPSGH